MSEPDPLTELQRECAGLRSQIGKLKAQLARAKADAFTPCRLCTHKSICHFDPKNCQHPQQLAEQ